METNELKNIWKKVDAGFNLKTKEELNQALAAKTKKTINKFLLILSIDIVVCIGMLVFLIITALNRQGDVLYLVNNSVIGSIVIISLIVSLLSLNKLYSNKFNLSLKDWVDQRIKMLSGWLLGKYSKLYIVLIPILLVMINLSIHVYYDHKPFIEVIKNEESIVGLMVGSLVGLFVAFFVLNKIRKFHLKNLESLKELHASLCNEQ
ncbi:MAG: hypothetical protein CVU00_06255 [Bacteroidetes bacterium HGW-Bacteroidetes-17]|jgi:hypothetical protein|nr:MAG: hypothetical protein CVU00_06255 [Bacteroidetes bacterium HGW-Bacteroidetes-17]